MEGERKHLNREPHRHERELPAELQLRPWEDPPIERLGFGPRSMYVEVCWLPVMGPTATWLYRRLGSWAEYNAEGTTIDITDLSLSLGLGEGRERRSKLARALGRLVTFEAVRWVGANELQVRRALPPLPARHVRQLSRTSTRLHEEFVRQQQRNRDDGSGLVK